MMMLFAKACQFGAIECVKYLLEQGCSQVHKVGTEKLTAMHLAAVGDHYKLVEYLCDNKGRVNSFDKYGRSPLILATI